ncbi:hypothetical protein Peur_071115 [Populus x canadensis]
MRERILPVIFVLQPCFRRDTITYNGMKLSRFLHWQRQCGSLLLTVFSPSFFNIVLFLFIPTVSSSAVFLTVEMVLLVLCLDTTREDEVLQPEAEDSTGAGLLLESHSDALLDCRWCRGGAAV